MSSVNPILSFCSPWMFLEENSPLGLIGRVWLYWKLRLPRGHPGLLVNSQSQDGTILLSGVTAPTKQPHSGRRNAGGIRTVLGTQCSDSVGRLSYSLWADCSGKVGSVHKARDLTSYFLKANWIWSGHGGERWQLWTTVIRILAHTDTRITIVMSIVT